MRELQRVLPYPVMILIMRIRNLHAYQFQVQIPLICRMYIIKSSSRVKLNAEADMTIEMITETTTEST